MAVANNAFIFDLCQNIIGLFNVNAKHLEPMIHHLNIINSQEISLSKKYTMIKLFSMKNQKKDGAEGQRPGTKRASAAQLRITKGNLLM